ncbi:type VI secretion system contractile sheath small subunit [Paraburkholderia sp. RG36]|uniref:Type VI secretion system contractile sheath small subunit n=2 Tax=Paraburkholderia tagetis TaxID=2913261 RepID=A0A9X1UHU2_9BURK|nr:type VI secretion system contractile sheath small subunit [Paraburkholderia tagetis]MCG5077019.1 type VI secretion system contractile sheath small subunit [Paraburkholderia tagetis]
MSNSKSTGQKFIGRNRAPRVQIEYDVETYGSNQSVDIPFVMGVLSDLAGKSNQQQPSMDQRKFLEIDVDNFDDRLKSVQPRAAFHVPNEISGDGKLAIDLTFESIEDFSPASVARMVPELNQLLMARRQLSNLLSYMDGKSNAETMLMHALKSRPLLESIARITAQTTDKPTAPARDQPSGSPSGGEPEA